MPPKRSRATKATDHSDTDDRPASKTARKTPAADAIADADAQGTTLPAFSVQLEGKKKLTISQV